MLNYTEYSLFNGLQSRADSSKFFVAKGGKTSPQDELQESLRHLLLQSKDHNDSSFHCRFPARSKFLKKTFNLSIELSFDRCTKYQEWLARVRADRASIVFSSYYMGNPSSSFGHLLLRLGKQEHENSVKKELLDQGINFGASPWTENPFLYAVLGLTGAFPGSFIALPYYYKVREYNDYESRDLWEYDLNLTTEEVSRMIDLLWEQGENYYDYYFLTENCGYYIVALIEAAAPRYQVTEKLRKWTIPSEAVVVLNKAGVLAKPVVRKSIRTQFYDKMKSLNPSQSEVVWALFQSMNRALEEKAQSFELPSIVLALDPEEQAKVVDAAIDYFDFRFSKEILLNEEPHTALKRILLLHRASLPIYDIPPKTAEGEDSPDKAHGSGRLDLGYVKQYPFNESFLVSYRFAFHDYLERHEGMPANSLIEIFKFQFQINEDEQRLRYFAPFKIESSPIWNRWDRNWSWGTKLALEDNYLGSCQNCRVTNLNINGGVTQEWAGVNISWLLDSNISYSDHYSGPKLKLFLGPKLGLRTFLYSDVLAASLNLAHYSELKEDFILEGNIRYNYQKNLGFNFGIAKEGPVEIYQINFLFNHY